MGIVALTREAVAAAAVETLGLDSEIADLETAEVLAAAVRRAASFNCPATPRGLTRVVEESLRGLVVLDQGDGVGSLVRDMLEDLVGYGDLIEAPVADETSGRSHRMLFLGQPSYVRVSDSSCLLLGVPAEGLSLFDEAISERIDHQAHVRRIELEPGEDPTVLLGGAGLRERTVEQWLDHPPDCAANELLADYDERLRSAGPSGTIDGCRLLDPASSPTYYAGRWRPPTHRDSGRFVVRHPLEFGPDAWAYAELAEGTVQRLVDLPVRHRMDRACDEAWRLQAAIDQVGGRPQRVRVQKGPAIDSAVLHLLSPIPSWAQRRLDALARALPRQRGSLISYSIGGHQLDEELSFLAKTMWIAHDSQGGKQ